MNRSWVSKFAGLVLVLTLITTSLVAGTYAKYVTTATGSAAVTVAKWKVDLGGMETTSSGAIVFDLISTLSDTGVDENLLAPGTVGSFALAYNTAETQVAHNLTITMDASDPLDELKYLKFYSDSTRKTEISTTTPSAIELLDADCAPDSPTNSAITVYWAWPFEDNTTTAAAIAYDAADTVDGVTPVTGAAVTLNFTATQLDTI